MTTRPTVTWPQYPSRNGGDQAMWTVWQNLQYLATQITSGVIVTSSKTTISPLSGGPPSGPAVGDIWFATGVGSNGETWQFIYQPTLGTYPWTFVGGPPITLGGSGGVISGASAFTDFPSSTSFTIPRNGVYVSRVGWWGNLTNIDSTIETTVTKNGSVIGTTASNLNAVAATNLSSVGTPLPYVAVAADVVKGQYWSNGPGSFGTYAHEIYPTVVN